MLGWMGLSLLGALNGSFFEKVGIRKIQLPFPHLYDGYTMFVKTPRQVFLHRYEIEDGPHGHLYELVQTRAFLYERSRLEMNLMFTPALLPAICRRYGQQDRRPIRFIQEEHWISPAGKIPTRERHALCKEGQLR